MHFAPHKVSSRYLLVAGRAKGLRGASFLKQISTRRHGDHGVYTEKFDFPDRLLKEREVFSSLLRYSEPYEKRELHNLLHSLCVHLPTDFEPYGERSLETVSSGYLSHGYAKRYVPEPTSTITA